MTITLTTSFLYLVGFSICMFILATYFCHSSGMFDGATGLAGGMNALFTFFFYVVIWALPSLLAWASWATWWRT